MVWICVCSPIHVLDPSHKVMTRLSGLCLHQRDECIPHKACETSLAPSTWGCSEKTFSRRSQPPSTVRDDFLLFVGCPVCCYFVTVAWTAGPWAVSLTCCECCSLQSLPLLPQHHLLLLRVLHVKCPLHLLLSHDFYSRFYSHPLSQENFSHHVF